MSDPTQLYEEVVNKRGEFNCRWILKSWEDEAFRREFLADPKKALEKEIGQKIPEGIQIHALEETDNRIYFVIPQKPALPAAEGVLSEEALAQVAAGLGFIFKASTTTYGSGGQTQPAVFLVWF